MRIRNKFIFSYLSVIVIILAISVFFSINGMKSLESRNMIAARTGVEKLVQDNVELTQGILTKVAERFVVIRSERVAVALKLILEGDKGLSVFIDQHGNTENHIDDKLSTKDNMKNYHLLRENADVQKLFSQKIFTPGQYHRIAGHVDLLDTNGVAVIHPNPDVQGKNYSIWKNTYPAMWKLVKTSFLKKQVSGYYSFVDDNNKKVRKYMSLQRVPGTSFIVSAVVVINKYFLPIQEGIREAGEETKKVTDQKILSVSSDALREFSRRGMWIALALFVFGILLAVWQADSTSKPIRELSGKVRVIGGGDFSVQIPETGSLEIRELAASFNLLGRELADYVDNLKKEVATRKEIESEIRVARKIQESLLPHTFPPFPIRNEFELFAALVPAKEMSGDFFDFFFIDDVTLVLVIADVSGKGLPAAIFMAVSRTLLRNLCLNSKGQTPADILNAANNFLVMDNEAAMFVTTFIAYYNVVTGEFVYANAGHNPFLSLRKNNEKQGDECGIQEFGVLSDLPLGVLENYTFTNGKYIVEKDEAIIFYTDGVTEALSPDETFYGTERFYSIIEENRDKTIDDIVNIIKDDVVEFQGEHQFDDITLMILRRESDST
jgi:sigma-B regulation protein RsbU (phosphoserine phosphatase)